MKRIISALSVLAFSSALGLAGCGDDDDGSNGGTAGKGNEPTAGAPADGNENLSCDPGEETTCQNDTDCDYVIDGTARTKAQVCGKDECLTDEDPNCARNCILRDLKMTSECAGCYADFVNCTIKHCVAACISDADSDECHECQETEGCRPTFDECSGLP